MRRGIFDALSAHVLLSDRPVRLWSQQNTLPPSLAHTAFSTSVSGPCVLAATLARRQKRPAVRGVKIFMVERMRMMYEDDVGMGTDREGNDEDSEEKDTSFHTCPYECATMLVDILLHFVFS